MKKGPKVLWACISEDHDEHRSFEKKKDVCRSFYACMGSSICCAYRDGCRPVKYERKEA